MTTTLTTRWSDGHTEVRTYGALTGDLLSVDVTR